MGGLWQPIALLVGVARLLERPRHQVEDALHSGQIARLRGDAEWHSDSARAIVAALIADSQS